MFVDDITLALKSQEALDNIVIELVKHFKLRDLGPIVKVQKSDQTRDWTQDLLDIYQML